MAIVAKIFDEHADFAGRREVEKIAFEIQRILVGANEMRDQVFMRGTVVEDLDVLRGLNVDTWVGCKARRQ